MDSEMSPNLPVFEKQKNSYSGILHKRGKSNQSLRTSFCVKYLERWVSEIDWGQGQDENWCIAKQGKFINY